MRSLTCDQARAEDENALLARRTRRRGERRREPGVGRGQLAVGDERGPIDRLEMLAVRERGRAEGLEVREGAGGEVLAGRNWELRREDLDGADLRAVRSAVTARSVVAVMPDTHSLCSCPCSSSMKTGSSIVVARLTNSRPPLKSQAMSTTVSIRLSPSPLARSRDRSERSWSCVRSRGDPAAQKAPLASMVVYGAIWIVSRAEHDRRTSSAKTEWKARGLAANASRSNDWPCDPRRWSSIVTCAA